MVPAEISPARYFPPRQAGELPQGEALCPPEKGTCQYPILAIPLCGIAGSVLFLPTRSHHEDTPAFPLGEGGPLAVDEGYVPANAAVPPPPYQSVKFYLHMAVCGISRTGGSRQSLPLKGKPYARWKFPKLSALQRKLQTVDKLFPLAGSTRPRRERGKAPYNIERAPNGGRRR